MFYFARAACNIDTHFACSTNKSASIGQELESPAAIDVDLVETQLPETQLPSPSPPPAFAESLPAEPDEQQAADADSDDVCEEVELHVENDQPSESSLRCQDPCSELYHATETQLDSDEDVNKTKGAHKAGRSSIFGPCVQANSFPAT